MIISYAQNFEDVMLYRALKHIKNGFYIDIGAAWPEHDSVTKHFYDNGWSGINIEPNPEFINKYKDLRPNDINLPIAISNESGYKEFNFIYGTGLSSLDSTIINEHTKTGFEYNIHKVRVDTLSQICAKYCQNKEIHFLKIDIEGYEEKALLGNDWETFRPWIVVVEATVPLSQTENYQEWEPILLEANYLFAYADGLNRFYVAKEHSDLLESFKYPPNVFDEFITFSQYDFSNKLNKIKDLYNIQINKTEELNHRLENIVKEKEEIASRFESVVKINDDLQNKLNQLQEEINRVHSLYVSISNSNSWRVTKPLRLARKFLRWLYWGSYHWITFSPTSRPRRIIKRIIIDLKNYVNNRLWLKKIVIKVLNHFPSLKIRLKNIGNTDISKVNIKDFSIENKDNLYHNTLSPRAHRIYRKLKELQQYNKRD